MLAFKDYPAAGRPLVILHGLFGTGDNWALFARGMQAAGHRVLALDLPNHGRSAWTDDISYAAMAAAVRDFPARQQA